MKKGDASKGKTEKKSIISLNFHAKPDNNQEAPDDIFATAFKYSPIGMCISTIDEGRYVEVNDVYLQFLGYSREELIGRTSQDINLWVDISDREKLIRELRQNGKVTDFELRFRDKKGNVHWGLTSALLINIEDTLYLLTQTNDITEKKIRNETLERSERFFKELTENSSDIIIITDEQGIIKYCSPSMERFAGYKPEEVIGKYGFNYFHPEDMETAVAEYDKALQSKDALLPQNTFRVIHKNGSVRYFAGTGKILLDNPDIGGVIMNVHDVTEKRHAEDHIKQMTENYRKFFEEHTAPGIIIDPKTRMILYINHAAADYYGWTREAMLGMKMDKLQAFADDEINTVIEKVIHRKQNRFELKHRLADGSVRDVEVFSSIIRIGEDDLIHSIIYDISERKKTEALLKSNEARYRLLADNVSDVIFTIDMNFNYTYASPSVLNLVGYTADEVLTMKVDQLVDTETLAWFAGMFAEEMEIEKRPDRDLKRSRVLEYQHVCKDGSRVWVENRITFLRDKNNNATGIIGTVRDITDRKKAEEHLQQREEQYRLLADHMKDAVWITDLNLKVTYVSPSCERMLGWTPEEIKNLPLDKLLTPDSFKRAFDFYNVELPIALAAPPEYVLKRSLELEFVAKDGQGLWGECMFTLLRDERGKATAILGESRNITERKHMENALRRSEENFRRSLDDSPLGIRISTVEGKTLYANLAILDMYGYDSVDELENTPLKERYTPESFAEFQARKAKRLKGEKGPSEYEIDIVRNTGEIRHLYVFRKNIEWNGSRQYQVVYQDITLRRRAEEKLNETLESLRQSIKITIQVLGTASEAKDPYMAGHQKRVADLARAIATEMKLPQEKIEAIRMASAIHDIGKISVPSEILCKPAILSDLEFSFVKNHPRYSYDIIKEVESPWPLADIVYQHHERMDGSGYPLGLKEKEILIESRILAVADVVEAMVSYRPYRPALEIKIALAEIENNAGKLYDHNVAQACLRLFREKGYQLS